MNAEYTDWSVTIYADNPEDVSTLRALCERARQQNVSFGSVGIFPNPPGCQPEPEDLVRFVGFQHRTWEELRELILQDCIPSDLRPKKVVLNWERTFKARSAGNRKHRLSVA